MKQITSVIIQLSYIKGIDTQAERNKIISEVKFILTMEYIPCFTPGLRCRLPAVSSLFSRRLKASGLAPSLHRNNIKNLLDLQHSMHGALQKCWLCKCPIVSVPCSILFFFFFCYLKGVPQEQMISHGFSLRSGCSSALLVWGHSETTAFLSYLLIWWYSNTLLQSCDLSESDPVFSFSEFGQLLALVPSCVCMSVGIRKS